MTLQSTGVISLSNIQTEFGGTTPISMSEYYSGGTNVPSGTEGVNGVIPSVSAVSISKYLGASNFSVFAGLPRGSLFGFGANSLGQLGVGTNVASYSSPVQAGSDTTWVKVSQASYATCAIKTNGTLWAWGGNGSLQLGVGGVTVVFSSPVQLGSLSTWFDVAVGQDHVLATKTDGTLWSWGVNLYGQLGDSTIVNKSSPIQIGSLTNWKYVAASKSHSASIKTDGTLWVWGSNGIGELGDGTRVSKSSPIQIGTSTWTKIALPGSSDWTLAIRSDGTLWSWGRDTSGQLGNGTVTNGYSSPIQVGSMNTWVDADCYNVSGIGIQSNSTLWTWGSNVSGQLGNGTTTAAYTPIQIGATDWSACTMGNQHSAAVKTNGTLWTWGSSAGGNLGGRSGNPSIPGQVGSLNTWKYCVGGLNLMLAVL